jgi:hypothetical protein
MMNNTLKSAPPPVDDLAPLDLIAKVLDLLSDPSGTAARVKALQEAANETRALLEKTKAASDALDKKRADHLDLMTQERETHQIKLREDRAAFDAEYNRRNTALREAEEKAAAAQAAAESAKQHAVTVSNDLESRLALIHSAAVAALPARH